MRSVSIEVLAALATACLLVGCGGSDPVTPPPASTARLALSSDRVVAEPGLRPQLSPDGQWVAFDWLVVPAGGGAARYAVHRVPVAGGTRECLTCDRAEVPRSSGAPAFHPDGDHVVFSFEKGSHAPVSGSAADPGGGLYNDLAVLRLSTGVITPIYTVGDGVTPSPSGSSGALHPHFSHDGTKLVWADLVGGPGGTGEIFGTFRIGLADFTPAPAPQLSNVRYVTIAGSKLIVVSGFSLDGGEVFVQCKSVAGQYDHEIDLCAVDIATSAVRRLTKTSGQTVGGTVEPAAYEEHAAPVPAGGGGTHSLVLFSSLGQGVNRASTGLLDWVATDLWSAAPRGDSLERLTTYNVAGTPQSDGRRAVVSKLGVNEAGTRMVYSLWRVGVETTGGDDRFEIRVAELNRR